MYTMVNSSTMKHRPEGASTGIGLVQPFAPETYTMPHGNGYLRFRADISDPDRIPNIRYILSIRVAKLTICGCNSVKYSFFPLIESKHLSIFLPFPLKG
jgi:hypothetical protein